MAKLPPDKRKAWAAFLLGRAWYEKARDDVARRHLEEAIALWPDLTLGHRYLSYISLRAESYDEGLAYSARACELDDEDKGLHWERLQFESLTGKQQTLPLAKVPNHYWPMPANNQSST